MVTHFFKTLNGSTAWAAINGVLENGGVVAGCSAGAMIFGQQIPSFPTIWSFQSGFNFLPGVIVLPHFDEFGESAFVGLLKTMSGKTTLLGIDGDTAVVRNDGKYEVAGAGGVTVWGRDGKVKYKTGDSLNLL